MLISVLMYCTKHYWRRGWLGLWLCESHFFLFVNMENLPNLLYSLAVDGNARKEKGSRKEKKEAIRKWEWSKAEAVAPQPTTPAENHAHRKHSGGSGAQGRARKGASGRRCRVDTTEAHGAASVTRIKDGSSQKKTQGADPSLPSRVSSHSEGKLIILAAK